MEYYIIKQLSLSIQSLCRHPFVALVYMYIVYIIYITDVAILILIFKQVYHRPLHLKLIQLIFFFTYYVKSRQPMCWVDVIDMKLNPHFISIYLYLCRCLYVVLYYVFGLFALLIDYLRIFIYVKMNFLHNNFQIINNFFVVYICLLFYIV